MGDKKYYWLKLKRDFFKRHDIQIIEAMPNGKDYVLFYLKLLVESVDHEGNLRFSDTIPYNESMLSTITNTNIDIVRSAMKMFIELKMIDLLADETIYMNEIQKMLGTETYWAEQKRKQRESEPKKIGQCLDNVQLMSNMSNQEKETDIELDKEIEKVPYQLIADTYNQICISLPRVKNLTNTRKRTLQARWKELNSNMDNLVDFLEKVEASDFLAGRKKDWSAGFDWIFKSANFNKIIEGTYDNKESNKTTGIAGLMNWSHQHKKVNML